MYLFFWLFFVIALICFLWNHHRKTSIIKKVCTMKLTEKEELLNEIIHPLGYHYLLCQDIFLSTMDAWQREFGYTRSYDCIAPYLNMVFDSEPVYFDYDGRTWMIELWKGQYGINTGAEIGIYCADKIIPIQKRSTEYFHTVPDEEIPVFSMNLYRTTKTEEQMIASVSMPHWWLAAFCMGCFSRPEYLQTEICIRFREHDMMLAFAEALMEMGYHCCSLQMHDSCICFSYCNPHAPVPCGFFNRWIRCIIQWKNRIVCRLYRIVTRPFHCTLDRLLYLYFYLPVIFRHCLRLRRCKKNASGCKKGKKR